ncbi:MAG: tRNA (N6-isopentenyl adenosine(37)-C2)-methylthiotransferase MiaB [Spirochaetales bacterium]|nr:tRNA (N6-isopentenyl adenosine(37)-C2)-methylthiotransferase MiaB [Spirochaetales bacterium]
MTGKFFIETYGCQMNTAESGALAASMIEAGWSEASSDKNADIIFINTCSVRKTAENRIWGRLGYFKRQKQEHDFKLVVIGCMAERLKDQIKKEFPVVDEVVSNFKKDRIADILSEGRAKLSSIAAELDVIDETYTFFDKHRSQTDSHAMIPIMNGCDNFCSYCIVPYVRGHEISRMNTDIISEIAGLNKNGVSEITLLGQNVNSYRYSRPGVDVVNFTALLKEIIKETDTKWIRFTSSNPQDFTDELIKLIADEKRICSFIHLPAQHGSDKILKRMNRKYTSDQYIKLALKLKNLDRKISLSSDLMVGFPGETDNDFKQLIELMEAVRFEEAFTYYYNPREGTAACDFEDDVPEEIKLARLSEIIDLQRRIGFEEKSLRIGMTVEAVIEGTSKKDSNEILARTERNSMVVYPGKITKMNDYVTIKLKDLKGNTFIGEV